MFNNIKSGMICIILGFLITSIAIVLDPKMHNTTSIDYARLILLGVLFIGYLIWLKIKGNLKKWAYISITISAPFFILVMNWLAIFTFTNYREDQKTIIYSLALIYLVFFFSILTFSKQDFNNSHNNSN